MDYLNKMLENLKSSCKNSYDYNTKKIQLEQMYNEIYKIGFYDGIEHQKISSQKIKDESKNGRMTYMGVTVKQNTNCSTWYARYRLGGKQHYISDATEVGCFGKLVQAKSQDNCEKILTERNAFSSNRTLSQWYETWLTLYKVQNVSKQTLRRYRTMWNTIPKTLKSTQMRNIRLHQLVELINAYKTGSQKKKIYDFMNMILDKAVDNDVIIKNLLKRVEKPKYVKVHSTALTIEEQNILITACKKVPFADLVVVALYQGFRRGEVLGITRDCVDFQKKKITINKAWSQDNEFTHTKNEQSVRVVPMFDRTYKILLKYKNQEPKSRIFNISIKKFEQMMYAVRKVSGLKVRIKDLRCTFITNCRNKNIPIHIVQTWVGHQIGSIVTSAIYTSYMENADEEYIKQYNKFTGKKL